MKQSFNRETIEAMLAEKYNGVRNIVWDKDVVSFEFDEKIVEQFNYRDIMETIHKQSMEISFLRGQVTQADKNFSVLANGDFEDTGDYNE